MKNVVEYTDYRLFLKELYECKKEDNPHFSHRYLAQKLGLKSSGHFAQILSGRLNISTALISRLVSFLNFKKKEADYFEAMVLYNQAKNHDERRRYFEKMLSLRGAKPSILDANKYEYYRKWYYTAVLEAIALKPFRGDCARLARMLTPRISPGQAAEAVELLQRLGLVRMREDGVYEKTNTVISSGYDAASVALSNFQIEMMELAKEAIDRFPRDRRNLSTVTVGVSKRELDDIIDELRAFRRKVLDIACGADTADRIYQFNIQLFPLTEPPAQERV